jgi:hypothetical protein
MIKNGCELGKMFKIRNNSSARHISGCAFVGRPCLKWLGADFPARGRDGE